jgi:hypothetical protein
LIYPFDVLVEAPDAPELKEQVLATLSVNASVEATLNAQRAGAAGMTTITAWLDVDAPSRKEADDLIRRLMAPITTSGMRIELISV